MKTSFVSSNKTNALILLLFSVITFFSCKKEVDNHPVSEEVAAEIITNAVSSERGGFVSQVDHSISIAHRHSTPLNCGQQKDTAIAVNYSGLAVSYAYNLNWKWKLTCSSNVPSRFNLNYTGTSAYDGVFVASNDKVNSALEVSGLEGSATNYVLNKHVTREGKQTSKRNTQSAFTSKTELTATNVAVEKATRKIKSGTIQVKFTTGHSQSSYDGTITFHGNNTATLTLSSGKTYNIRW